MKRIDHLNPFTNLRPNSNLSGRTAQPQQRQTKAGAAATAEQNHVTNGAYATPNLRPLSRLMQQLLLPQTAGGWRRFGFRRYLWLLKRYHQRRRQPGSGISLSPRLAQTADYSPLESRPLENPRLRQALQHRGPVWWFRATALRGEEAAQQLLRQLLLQQKLWLQLRSSKQRRQRQLRRQRGRSFPAPRSRLWKKNVKRILRPLRRSRRRHQLKAQENLGRNYREKELRLLTFQLVAALEPKLQAHRRRADRAHLRAHSPAKRLLQWLRGGSLPSLRAGSAAMRQFRRRLKPVAFRQLHPRRQRLRRRHLWRRLRSLQRVREWLREHQAMAKAAKKKREEEEGETSEEPANSQPLSAEERRLEEADRQLEETGGFSHLSREMARLEAILRRSPLNPRDPSRRKGRSRQWLRAEYAHQAALTKPLEAEKQRLEVVYATLALLQTQHPLAPQQRWSQLARALRRWRRRLLREQQRQLLQHPLLRAPDQAWEAKKIEAFWKKHFREEQQQQQLQAAEGRKGRQDSVLHSGLGHPAGRATRQSPEQLRERWKLYFRAPQGDGFRSFSPLSFSVKGGLFQWHRLLDYWVSGELPTQYRQRRRSRFGQPEVQPKPLPAGIRQQNRHRLLDYLGLELQLLESQLELRDKPELLHQLSRRYPLDKQGRLIYPQPTEPNSPTGDSKTFYPPKALSKRAPRGASKGSAAQPSAERRSPPGNTLPTNGHRKTNPPKK